MRYFVATLICIFDIVVGGRVFQIWTHNWGKQFLEKDCYLIKVIFLATAFVQ